MLALWFPFRINERLHSANSCMNQCAKQSVNRQIQSGDYILVSGSGLVNQRYASEPCRHETSQRGLDFSLKEEQSKIQNTACKKRRPLKLNLATFDIVVAHTGHSSQLFSDAFDRNAQFLPTVVRGAVVIPP